MFVHLKVLLEHPPHIFIVEDLLLFIGVYRIPLEVPVKSAFRPERLVDIMLDHSFHDFIGAGPDISESGNLSLSTGPSMAVSCYFTVYPRPSRQAPIAR